MPSARRLTRRVPGRTDDVVIVGAGLGGLAAALRLAGSGRQVTLLEQADIPGGRAGRLCIDGYAFDTGPTVLTMPELIEDAFHSVGERMSDWLELLPISPAYRADFADGSVLDVHTDPARMEQEIAQVISARDAAGYRDLVRFLQRLYALEMNAFIDRNLDSPLQLIGTAGARLAALGGLRRLAPKIGQFVRDERLRRVFSFQAMYAGLAPQQALAIYAVIAYMDTVAGVYFPRGGMHALPRAMAAAASAHGVQIRYGTRVERVEVDAGRARAVHTALGERIRADVVVLNADLPIAYAQLVGQQHTPRRVRQLRYSPSCALLHVGARVTHPELAHHSIFFGAAWEQTFREIIDDGVVMSDPSFLVSNPSGTDATLAPAGASTYYILFPTPNARADLDWHRIGPAYRDHMIATAQQRGLTGLGDAIEVESLVTPQDWRDSGLAAGAPFAAAHTFAQSGPFRTPTLDRQIENLVFCGSNTQPGVGVPMVLLSGKLAAARITG